MKFISWDKLAKKKSENSVRYIHLEKTVTKLWRTIKSEIQKKVNSVS